MTFNRVDSLTSTDVTDLIAYYGENYDQLIEDLKNETVPESINVDDAFAWALEMLGSSELDPSSSELAYLFESPDVLDMLEDMYFKNSAEADLALLTADVEAYLAVGGLDVSSQGLADIFIENYKTDFGEPGASSGIDNSDLLNLAAFVKQFNPGLYLIIKGMEMGNAVEDALGDIFDRLEELQEDLNDMIDDVGDFDVDENNEAQQMQLEIQQIQSSIQAYQDIAEQLIDIVNQTIRTGSEWWDKHAQTASSILN